MNFCDIINLASVDEGRQAAVAEGNNDGKLGALARMMRGAKCAAGWDLGASAARKRVGADLVDLIHHYTHSLQMCKRSEFFLFSFDRITEFFTIIMLLLNDY